MSKHELSLYLVKLSMAVKHQIPEELSYQFQQAKKWKIMLILCFSSFVIFLLLSIQPYYSLPKSRTKDYIELFLNYILGGFGMVSLNMWAVNSASLYNYKKSKENVLFLEELIDNKLPYGIYLRDFDPEIVPVDSGLAFSAMALRSDMVEHSIIKEIDRYIPFFGLFNKKDIDDDPVARRIYCSTDWIANFTHYSAEASLFIINIDHITESIDLELKWLMGEDIKGRILFLCPREVLEELNTRYHVATNKHWVLVREARKGTYGGPSMKAPKEVLQYIKSLNKKP